MYNVTFCVCVCMCVQKEWSPLVLASRAGDLEIVQGIVALGAEIDLPTNVSSPPLNMKLNNTKPYIAIGFRCDRVPPKPIGLHTLIVV